MELPGLIIRFGHLQGVHEGEAIVPHALEDALAELVLEGEHKGEMGVRPVSTISDPRISRMGNDATVGPRM